MANYMQLQTEVVCIELARSKLVENNYPYLYFICWLKEFEEMNLSSTRPAMQAVFLYRIVAEINIYEQPKVMSLLECFLSSLTDNLF